MIIVVDEARSAFVGVTSIGFGCVHRFISNASLIPSSFLLICPCTDNVSVACFSIIVAWRSEKVPVYHLSDQS